MTDTAKMDRCKFSTYGYACGKPVEHGRYLCDDHAASTCSSCGAPATHGCDFCGQFVCGAPLCDECTYATDSTKPKSAWGFGDHIHVSLPEFADKHRMTRQDVEIATLRTELDQCREALTECQKLLADLTNDDPLFQKQQSSQHIWARAVELERRIRAMGEKGGKG